jgi:uncharacterized protein DUF1573
MKSKFLFLAIVMLSSTALFAQSKAYIKFDTLYHDFGNIHEEDGKVITKFNFINTGTDTLKIITAPASCSCTQTDWTHEPVPPGGKGWVSADFNPYRHSGVTEKHVTVTTNAIDSVVILNFKVTTVPKTKTFVDSFPEKKGNLFFGDRQFNLRNITNEQVKKDSMEVYNSSAKPMKLLFTNLPAFITANAASEIVAPFSRGKIFINYDASKKDDFGVVTDNITLKTDDENMPEKNISIAATITENFSKLTQEQRADAPKIVFPNKETMDFGTVNEGDIAKVNFDFMNNGKTPLIIRKATAGKADCKIIMPDKKSYSANEKGTIGIEFNTKGQTGNDVRRTVMVTTNDPDRSFMILIIKGNVR